MVNIKIVKQVVQAFREKKKDLSNIRRPPVSSSSS